jgi:hypothetical protein
VNNIVEGAVICCKRALIANEKSRPLLEGYSFFDHIGHTEVLSAWRSCMEMSGSEDGYDRIIVEYERESKKHLKESNLEL